MIQSLKFSKTKMKSLPVSLSLSLVLHIHPVDNDGDLPLRPEEVSEDDEMNNEYEEAI